MSAAKKKTKSTQTDVDSNIAHTTQNFYIYASTPRGDDYGGDDDADDPDYLPEGESDNKLKRCYTQDDVNYYDKLNKKQKKKVDKMEEDVDKVNFFQTPMRFRILDAPIDINLKHLAIQKIDELGMMFPGSGEYFKLKNWIEHLCKLPIGKYKSLPVSRKDNIEKISTFMQQTKTRFEERIYGHNETKNQIVQLLAKLISNPSANGIVIGIQGPCGVGKTTFLSVLGEILDIPLGFVSLAGANDEHVFRGFSITYENSRWGKMADILMKAQCMNPILYFDELDKISTSHHGEEVANFLIHLTDFSQNHKFQDYYFGDIDLDLSKCMFIFSYNNEELINPILKDRMITIKAKGYNLKDKLVLAKDYMLGKIYKEYGFNQNELVFGDNIIEYVISKVDDEEGVRNMKRGLEEIIGSLNFNRILGSNCTFPLEITKDVVDQYLIINKKKTDAISKHMMYI